MFTLHVTSGTQSFPRQDEGANLVLVNPIVNTTSYYSVNFASSDNPNTRNGNTEVVTASQKIAAQLVVPVFLAGECTSACAPTNSPTCSRADMRSH